MEARALRLTRTRVLARGMRPLGRRIWASRSPAETRRAWPARCPTGPHSPTRTTRWPRWQAGQADHPVQRGPAPRSPGATPGSASSSTSVITAQDVGLVQAVTAELRRPWPPRRPGWASDRAGCCTWHRACSTTMCPRAGRAADRLDRPAASTRAAGCHAAASGAGNAGLGVSVRWPPSPPPSRNPDRSEPSGFQGSRQQGRGPVTPRAIGGSRGSLPQASTRYRVQSASVGDMRAARSAGSSPAAAPITMVAPSPPA